MVGGLVSLLVAVLVIGLLFYLIGMLPVDGRVKMVANVILIVIAIVWLLRFAGVAIY
jgi:hypothetical protein